MNNNKCPDCETKLENIDYIINTHLTGDKKYINLSQCSQCNEYYLIVSMEATIGSGNNYFKFMIKLNDKEYEKIRGLMNKCPHDEFCDCPAHNYLDDFDKENHDRRIIIENIIERW